MSSTGSMSNGFSQDSSGKATGVLPFFDDDLPIDDDDFDPFAGLFDDEQKSIVEIKEKLEDPDLVCLKVFFTWILI